jgi:hypothetical protein
VIKKEGTKVWGGGVLVRKRGKRIIVIKEGNRRFCEK